MLNFWGVSMIPLGMMKCLILLRHDWFDFQHAKTATYQKNWGGIGRIFDRVVQGSLKIHAHPGSLGMYKEL